MESGNTYSSDEGEAELLIGEILHKAGLVLLRNVFQKTIEV
jgi:hypothetical protein